MATQTFEVIGPPGLTGVTGELYPVGSDTIQGSPNNATRGINTQVVYTFTASSTPAGDYRVVLKWNSTTVAETVFTGVTDTATTYRYSDPLSLVSLIHSQTDDVTVDAFTQNALDQLSAVSITVSGPLSSDGTELTLIQDDDYYTADGRQLTFDIEGTFPAWTGGSTTLRMKDGGVVETVAGTITDATGMTRQVTFDVDAETTAELPYGTGDWQITVDTSGGHRETPVANGKLIIGARIE